MVLNIHKKKQIVNTIHEITKNAISAVVASLDGIKVNEITKLRKEARELGVSVHIVKNTLMNRAIKETPFQSLKDIIFGQVIIAFSMINPRDSASVFVKFNKSHDNFKIRGAVFEGKLISSSRINILANLPDRKQAIFQLIFVLKTNNIGNLIHVLNLIIKQ